MTRSVIFDLLSMLSWDGRFLHLSDQILRSWSFIPGMLHFDINIGRLLLQFLYSFQGSCQSLLLLWLGRWQYLDIFDEKDFTDMLSVVLSMGWLIVESVWSWKIANGIVGWLAVRLVLEEVIRLCFGSTTGSLCGSVKAMTLSLMCFGSSSIFGRTCLMISVPWGRNLLITLRFDG